MKYELQVFVALIIVGLVVKRVDWRGQFLLFLSICAWVFFNANR